MEHMFDEIIIDSQQLFPRVFHACRAKQAELYNPVAFEKSKMHERNYIYLNMFHNFVDTTIRMRLIVQKYMLDAQQRYHGVPIIVHDPQTFVVAWNDGRKSPTPSIFRYERNNVDMSNIFRHIVKYLRRLSYYRLEDGETDNYFEWYRKARELYPQLRRFTMQRLRLDDDPEPRKNIQCHLHFLISMSQMYLPVNLLKFAFEDAIAYSNNIICSIRDYLGKHPNPRYLLISKQKIPGATSLRKGNIHIARHQSIRKEEDSHLFPRLLPVENIMLFYPRVEEACMGKIVDVNSSIFYNIFTKYPPYIRTTAAWVKDTTIEITSNLEWIDRSTFEHLCRDTFQ
jgi:hypothetical protein